MTYFHAFLEIIGALSLITLILMIMGAYCIGGRRNHLDRFHNPNEPRLVKIVKSPWRKG